MNKSFKIIVRGGLVQDVLDVPDGLDYEIIDYDNLHSLRCPRLNCQEDVSDEFRNDINTCPKCGFNFKD
jgi:hypothetical protein